MSNFEPKYISEIEVHGRKYEIDPPVCIQKKEEDRSVRFSLIFSGQEVERHTDGWEDPTEDEIARAEKLVMADLAHLVEMKIEHEVTAFDYKEAALVAASFTPPKKDVGGSQ